MVSRMLAPSHYLKQYGPIKLINKVLWYLSHLLDYHETSEDTNHETETYMLG